MTVDPRPRVLPQAVLDAMPGAVAQLSLEGEIQGVNASWQTLAERSSLLPGTNVTTGANYLDACDRAAAAGNASAREAVTALRAVLSGASRSATLEYDLAGQSATSWIELIATRIEGDGFNGVLVTHVDITPRKAAAEALVRSETQYRAIVESAPVGIYQTTPDGRIVAANQCLAEIVAAASPEALVGSNISRFYASHDDSAALVDQHERTQASTPVELEWRRTDGAPIWVEMATRAIRDAAGRTMYWEGFVYDISERKRLEAQLTQAQKMETVGRLAGGIAHDFNNLLTVMIGYAELLHVGEGMPTTFRPAVGEILAAARRAAELTGRMLAFARKQRVQPRPVNVNDVVRSVEGLLRRIIGEDIRLDVRLSPDLPAVLIDPAQLEQVLMNLAVNARDAMPNGGTVTISSDLVEITSDQVRHRPGLRTGRQVSLALADTGVGMDAETLARVFEPFFTTKEPGKGTGLGLAMCYGIVKQANGFIGCESTKGAGTTCTVLLPAAAEQAEALLLPQDASHPPESKKVPGTTILVVEDEPVVRQFVADVLRASGHVVYTTGSPQEGLEIAAVQKTRLALLVTDVVMPQMDGVSLAARIRADHPELRVLLMSGYPDRPMPANQDTSMMLAKPFTAAQLRARVTEALQMDGTPPD